MTNASTLPGLPRFSRSEDARALAAAQERTDSQRRCQDCWARARMSLPMDLTLARARRLMTTRFLRPSGFQRVLGTSSPCGGGLLARRHNQRWHTGGVALHAVSMASRAPWKTGNLSARRPSTPPRGSKSRSPRHELQAHGRCVPQQTQARIRVFRAPQKSSTLHGGGQGRREDGHQQVRDERGRGRRRRRKRRTRKSTESNRW